MKSNLSFLKKIIISFLILFMSASSSLFAQHDAFFWCSVQGSPMGTEGIEVTIDGVTVTSGFDGLALFEGLAVGDHNYTASFPGYVSQSGTISIVDQNVQEFITLLPAPTAFDAFFWCSEQGSPMGMSGVEVTIDGVTVTSEFDGLALFESLSIGDHNYTAAKTGYTTQSGTITIVDQNVQEFIIMVPATYDMFFWCSEQGNPMGMSGVDITIDGVTITSDFDGLALFEGYDPGTYNFTASKEGYYPQSGNVTITDQNVEEFIIMQLISSDVLFWITDEITELPLEDAMVTFNDQLIYTDVNGLAWFEAVPMGEYLYTVSKEGYISTAGTVEVDENNWAENVSLAPYAFDIFFWCSEEGNPMGLSGVDITIDGVTGTSDFDGLVIFETMSPGTYDYTATKDGYAIHTGQVNVMNENVQEFVVLSLVYDVTFIVDDGRGLIEGAEINMNGVTQITNEFGEATFINILNGTYDFQIMTEDYADYEGSIEVNGDHLEVQISLILSNATEQDHFQISIYPNPTSDFINIAGMEKYDCYIYSQSGQLIFHEKKENDHSKMDLRSLPTGLYHIQLQSGDHLYKDKILIAH